MTWKEGWQSTRRQLTNAANEENGWEGENDVVSTTSSADSDDDVDDVIVEVGSRRQGRRMLPMKRMDGEGKNDVRLNEQIAGTA